MTAVAHTLRMAEIASRFDDADDAADERAKLRDARKRIADLETERLANRDTIHDLQELLAVSDDQLMDARVEASDLAGQLTDARDTLADRDLELGSLRDDLANALTALRSGVAA